MNKQIIVIAVLAMVAAAAAGGWWAQRQLSHTGSLHSDGHSADGHSAGYYSCAMHPQVRQDTPGQCPICGMALSRHEQLHATAAAPEAEPKVLYWYDPMRPDHHFEQPGPSPFMDMALLPRYADGADPASAALVQIDPRMAQNLGMRTAPVTAGPSRQHVDAVGSVAVDERRVVSVEARAAGWVEHLAVRSVGETVQRGQLLAGLYAPELLAAQQELALALKLGDAALIQAARSRLSLLGVSGSEQPQRRVALRAPQAGVVTELMVREGAQLMPGMPLLKLADLSRVWILVEVPEAQAGWIAAGQRAQARLRALPGRSFQGTVDYVYPLLDGQTRTLRARLVFDNADGALKPGMYAEVSLEGQDAAVALQVPSEAVIRTGSRNVVLVAEAQGRYRPVEVKLGTESDAHIVVLDGLEAGQQVVVSGQFLIDSEASLRGAYHRLGDGLDGGLDGGPNGRLEASGGGDAP